jgi:hypothetical protein
MLGPVDLTAFHKGRALPVPLAVQKEEKKKE